MAKTNTLRTARDILSCFYVDGILLDIPRGAIGLRNLPKANIETLKRYFELLLNSDMISVEGKIFIKNKYITTRGVTEEINNMRVAAGMREISEANTYKKMCSDNRKLDDFFGKEMLNDLVYSASCDIEYYNRRIIEAFSKGKHSKYKENILIPLSDKHWAVECDQDKFNEFLNKLSKYTKEYVKKLGRDQDPQVVGYFNYILMMQSSGFMNNVDKTNWLLVKRALGIEEEF